MRIWVTFFFFFLKHYLFKEDVIIIIVIIIIIFRKIEYEYKESRGSAIDNKIQMRTLRKFTFYIHNY